MGVLDRLKAYQRLAQTPEAEMEATPQPSTQPERLPGGATSEGTSFLQQFIIEMLKKNHIPPEMLRMIPVKGFGEQIHRLLFGDPYEAHTFFADMHYQVGQLLEQDSDWDPVEVAREREYAAAQERSALRQTTAEYNEQLRRSAESSTGGPLDGIGQDRQWKKHSLGYPDEALFGSVPYFESADSGQQAEI